MTAEGLLAGRCVLVIEDDYYIAGEMRHVLQEAGAKVLGPVPTIDAALQLLGETPSLDGAMLDINLRGEMGYPVADALIERGVPFVFTTGYDVSFIPPTYDAVALCEKPIELGKVARALFG